jgi:hypothetical protein
MANAAAYGAFGDVGQAPRFPKSFRRAFGTAAIESR